MQRQNAIRDSFFADILDELRQTIHPGLEIRLCTTQAEFAACIELHQGIWNFAPKEVLSARTLALANLTGGHVYGVYRDGKLIAFALAFMAIRDGSPYLHSNIVAVLPSFQGKRIGRLIKLYQREQAMQHGIQRIEWTFDPLETRNAYFNITKLGAQSHRFISNLYGVSTSPLHRNLPTDRLVAKWELDSEQVHCALAGRAICQPPASHKAVIRLPRNIDAIRVSAPEQIEVLQANLRRQFMDEFQKGLAVTAFELSESEAHYFLN